MNDDKPIEMPLPIERVLELTERRIERIRGRVQSIEHDDAERRVARRSRILVVPVLLGTFALVAWSIGWWSLLMPALWIGGGIWATAPERRLRGKT